MDNVFFEIQRFNADSRINHLHSMYENSSFMNCPEKDYSSGYFDDGSDMLLLADNKQYLVQKGWSDKALNAFIAAAKEMLYRIEKDSK